MRSLISAPKKAEHRSRSDLGAPQQTEGTNTRISLSRGLLHYMFVCVSIIQIVYICI